MCSIKINPRPPPLYTRCNVDATLRGIAIIQQYFCRMMDSDEEKERSKYGRRLPDNILITIFLQLGINMINKNNKSIIIK